MSRDPRHPCVARAFAALWYLPKIAAFHHNHVRVLFMSLSSIYASVYALCIFRQHICLSLGFNHSSCSRYARRLHAQPGQPLRAHQARLGRSSQSAPTARVVNQHSTVCACQPSWAMLGRSSWLGAACVRACSRCWAGRGPLQACKPLCVLVAST